MQIVPAGWNAVTMDDDHRLVKQLGQRRCTPQHPQCGRCPLQQLCPSGHTGSFNDPLRSAAAPVNGG